MKSKPPALLWIIDNSLAELLDRATWLETSAELCNLGWQVTLISSGFPTEGIDKRIRVIRLARPRIYLIGYLVFHLHLLYRIITEWMVTDIVLFHQFSAPFLLPLVMLRNLFHQKLPKFVMDTRDMAVDKNTIKGRVWRVYFYLAHKLADRLSDGQTAITLQMAREVGIPNWQLLGTWPSGVKLEQFSSATLSRQWAGSMETLKLVYIGTINEQRNLMALCEAVKLVRTEGLAVTLTLVGKGPLTTKIERYCMTQNDNGIVLRPAVPHSEVAQVLAKADIGVLPFLDLPHWRVASFVKMFEYLAAGLPVLATQIVSHTDVLSSDYVFWAGDGSVNDLASAIRDAYTQRAALSRMSAKAAKAANSWTWEASAKKLDISLRKALANIV